MIIKQILSFVKGRCGEENVTYVMREINHVVTRLWNTTDMPGSLYDMVVEPASERILILPWYVAQVKAVKRAGGAEVTLFTPRAVYQDNAWRQDLLSWVFMSHTPLLRPLTNIGRLTAKLQRAETAALTVTITGPGEFGTRDVHDLDFAVGDRTQQTAEVVRDIISLSKSRVTTSDVLLYDVTGQLVAGIPADRTDVQNIQVRVTDQCIQMIASQCNRFSVLYKIHPPVFTNANEAIDDNFGLIVQNLVAAEILSKDEKNVRRMVYHGNTASSLLNEQQQRLNEGMSMKVKVPREPFTHEFYGHL